MQPTAPHHGKQLIPLVPWDIQSLELSQVNVLFILLATSIKKSNASYLAIGKAQQMVKANWGSLSH
jgi:hypothetical protein